MTSKNWLHFWGLALLWGSSFLWIKIAVAETSPEMLVALRISFGLGGILALLMVRADLRLPFARVRPYLAPFALIALVSITIPFLLISWAEMHIDSGLASILNATTPLFTILIANFYLQDDRITPWRLAGLATGFVGILILVAPDLTKSLNDSLLGQGAMLLATLSYAVGGVLARRKTQGLPPTYQSLLQLFFATVYGWLAVLILDWPITLPALPLTWLSIVWLGLLGSFAAYLLFFALLNEVGPTRTTMVTYVLPLMGVVMGALFLAERPSWNALAGGALILSGVMIVNRGK